MKIAIIQPSFLPWRGYFHLIQRCDKFVFYDDVQYDKHSWRNRNLIKTESGPRWLTVPVLTRNKFGQRINEVEINNVSGARWAKKMSNTIYHNYRKAKCFNKYFSFFEPIFLKEWSKIAELDIATTIGICDLLGIKRSFHRASELGVSGERIPRLIGICKKLGGNHYISGPSAKNYIKSDEKFVENGITLEFHRYDYPEYEQLYGGFEPNVSIIDLLFNCGDNSPGYIWRYPEIK